MEDKSVQTEKNTSKVYKHCKSVQTEKNTIHESVYEEAENMLLPLIERHCTASLNHRNLKFETQISNNKFLTTD